MRGLVRGWGKEEGLGRVAVARKESVGAVVVDVVVVLAVAAEENGGGA